MHFVHTKEKQPLKVDGGWVLGLTQKWHSIEANQESKTGADRWKSKKIKDEKKEKSGQIDPCR